MSGLGTDFYRCTIYSILRLVFDDIRRPTRRSMSLPPLLVLCTALRFYASGSLYLVLGDCLLISPASLCRCVNIVSKALVKRSPEFIKWPSVQGLEELKNRFYDIAGTSTCVILKLNADQFCLNTTKWILI